MTAKELISILSRMDPDSPVVRKSQYGPSCPEIQAEIIDVYQDTYGDYYPVTKSRDDTIKGVLIE